ncbi:hypothetical protein [Rubellicoccus peritrichatus]|uniref:Uncharacterized protein n=1 Tax=Rubellicoccus peritrichatus TaxID=3080537 RepID=A0AAQ3LDS8_9BACT|nr:hypothetical protein [Puniceicoccus sp. CR14]WOO42579.1 hypothetical protein RZN69_05710 [Puniceicoccus sp. CR14]
MKITNRIFLIAALVSLSGLAPLQAQTDLTVTGDLIVEGAGGATIDHDLQVSGDAIELGVWTTPNPDTTALLIGADTSTTPAKITFSGSATDTYFSWETDGTATTPVELMRLSEDGVFTIFDTASSNTMVLDPSVPSLTANGIDYLAGYGTATKLVDSLGNTVALVDANGNLVFDAGSTVTFDGAVIANGTLVAASSLQVGTSEAVDGDRFEDIIEVSKLLTTPDTSAEDWITNLYGSSVVSIAGVGVDNNNYRYIAGTFHGVLVLGDETLTSAGEEDIFIAKLNASGLVLWAKSYGGSDADVVDAMSVSSTGKFAIGGHFKSSDLDFTGSSLPKAGTDEDVFVARITGSTGDTTWATAFDGSNRDDLVNAISIDTAGEVTVAGAFKSNSFQVGSTSLTKTSPTNSESDIFVAQLDAATGDPHWVKSFASDRYDYAGALATDGTSIFMTGHYRGPSITFDSTTLTSAGNVDFFIACLDITTGITTWAQSFGDNSYEYAEALALDNNGDVIIGGNFASAQLAIGGTTLARSGSYDSFVIRMAGTDGTVVWATSFTCNADDGVTDLSFSNNSEVIVTGYHAYSPNVPLEIVSGEILPSAGSYDIYVAGLDNSDGNANWARSFGSSGDDGPTSIIAAPDDNISLTVSLASAAAFGSRVGLDAALYTVDPVWLQAYSPAVPSQTSLSIYGGAAIGESAIALGAGSIAQGDGSFVWGANNVALGTGSTALGSYTSAGAYLSAAMGQYNIGGFDGANNGDTQWVDLDTLFEIGNGTDEANRSNALTLLKNGQLTLENKYWDDQSPTTVPADSNSSDGNALVVNGHSQFNGNVNTKDLKVAGDADFEGSVTIAKIPAQGGLDMGGFDGSL